MPRKPKAKPDDPAQSKRFIEAARAYGTDETGKAFERVFTKVVPRDSSKKQSRKVGNNDAK